MSTETTGSSQAAQNAEGLKLRDLWERNCLVFCTTAGKPLDFRNVATASFKPLLTKATPPDIRFHDLRHTCATLLLSRGHHLKLVRELLGHSTLLRGHGAGPLQPRPARNGDQTTKAMEAALS